MALAAGSPRRAGSASRYWQVTSRPGPTGTAPTTGPARGSGTGLNAPTTQVSGQVPSPTLVSRWVGTTVASSPASTARSGSDGSARWSQVKWNTVDPQAVATSAISTATG